MPTSCTRQKLERDLCVVLAEKLRLNPDNIRLDDDVIADLGADSLAMAELTVQLEQQLHASVPGEAWLDVDTVGELADLIERYRRTPEA